jgi:gas vesicle protein
MKPAQGFLLFVGGVILGGAAALLFAPEKGEKTRKDIKDFFEHEKNKLMDAVEELGAEIKDEEKKVGNAVKRVIRKK